MLLHSSCSTKFFFLGKSLGLLIVLLISNKRSKYSSQHFYFNPEIRVLTIVRVENNHYFLDTMVGYGYGYRPFEKSYGWLWLGYITILTIITKITVLTIITIITIITINGYHG